MKINDILNGIQSAQGIINSIAGLFDSGAGNWKDSLQQASYKGIPFGVLQTDIQFGRRNAVHEFKLIKTEVVKGKKLAIVEYPKDEYGNTPVRDYIMFDDIEKNK